MKYGKQTGVELILDQDELHSWQIEELEQQLADLRTEQEFAEYPTAEWYEYHNAWHAALEVLNIKQAQIQATADEDYVECLIAAGIIG